MRTSCLVCEGITRQFLLGRIFCDVKVRCIPYALHRTSRAVTMPPLSLFQSTANGSYASASEKEFQKQWTQSVDVFSILLLLGGEIVNRALAQLSGGLLTPVSFFFGSDSDTNPSVASFAFQLIITAGWVSYAMNMLSAAVGDAKLMPSSTENACLLINAKNGYIRNNAGWVLGRMLRDYES